MASSCTREGLDSILGNIYSQKEESGIGTGCQGSRGITTTGRVQKSRGCGMWGHASVVNMVLG